MARAPPQYKNTNRLPFCTIGTILAFLCLGAVEVAPGLGAAASIGDQIRETAKSSQTELENQPKGLERINKDAKE